MVTLNLHDIIITLMCIQQRLYKYLYDKLKI